MIDSFERVLILSAHTDDAELAAGGTIARLVKAGADVTHVVFSPAAKSLTREYADDQGVTIREFHDAQMVLGVTDPRVLHFETRTFPAYRQEILQELIDIKARDHYDLVIGPSANDCHQDHRVLAAEAFRAFRRHATIWGYEMPENGSFQPDLWVTIKPGHADLKHAALVCYESQKKKPGFQFETHVIEAQMVYRGGQVHARRAEAFEVRRMTI